VKIREKKQEKRREEMRGEAREEKKQDKRVWRREESVHVSYQEIMYVCSLLLARLTSTPPAPEIIDRAREDSLPFNLSLYKDINTDRERMRVNARVK